jgi:hypothetical protein
MSTVSDLIGRIYADAEHAPGAYRTDIQKSCDELLEIATRDAMAEQAVMSSVAVFEAPAPMSSVEIAGRQKGPPAVTVKSYGASIDDAARDAIRVYNEVVTQMSGGKHDTDE